MTNPTNTEPASCCHAAPAPGSPHAAHAAPAGHTPAPHAGHAHHAHAGHATSPRGLATAATLHCLTGCAIGEFIGLAIGVSLGLNPWTTMALATALGFVSGYTLGLWPLVKQGMTWRAAFAAIWLGETISIAVMELAMNFTDYHVGGVQAGSVLSLKFWLGFAAALPAGFLVAWPVNYWLLARNVKKPCH
jgi:hypothetical protein